MDMDGPNQLIGEGDSRESSSSTSTSTASNSGRRSRTTSLSAAAPPFSQFENGLDGERREIEEPRLEEEEEIIRESEDDLDEEMRELEESVLLEEFEQVYRVDRGQTTELEFGDGLAEETREFELLLAEVNGSLREVEEAARLNDWRGLDFDQVLEQLDNLEGELVRPEVDINVEGEFDNLLESLVVPHISITKGNITDRNRITSIFPCFHENFEVEEEVCQLHCTHIFHENCITLWFTRKNNCPVCRAEY